MARLTIWTKQPQQSGVSHFRCVVLVHLLVAESTLIRRFRRYCTELQLSPGLDLDSLRRAYATHLIEDGWDPLFVQQQMGHEHASTKCRGRSSRQFRGSRLTVDRRAVETSRPVMRRPRTCDVRRLTSCCRSHRATRTVSGRIRTW
jgi:hypothetical protein